MATGTDRSVNDGQDDVIDRRLDRDMGFAHEFDSVAATRFSRSVELLFRRATGCARKHRRNVPWTDSDYGTV